METLPVIALLVVATVLFASERLRADMVAMIVLACLVLLKVLEPGQALVGFASPATITVASMFVLSAGLQSSGAVQFLGDRLLRHGPSSRSGLQLLTGAVVAPVSAFINNTAAVAVFLPIVLRACRGRQVSPSQLMMPLSFFAMLGGTCTLIGTSTNLVVNSFTRQHGLEPFGMFEFSQVGLILFFLGSAYLLITARTIPQRVKAESLTQGYHLNLYLSEVVVLEDSPLIGQTVTESRLGERYDLEVLGHVRDKVLRAVPGGHGALGEGDILLVKAPAAALVQLRDRAGIAVRPGRRPDVADLRSDESALIEAVVTPNSELGGRSLKSSDFRNRFGATALAIRRHGEDILEKIGRVRLRTGDELLILTPRDKLERLRGESSFVILQELEVPVIQPGKALTACAIVAGVVLVATLNLYPIAEAALVGAVLMVGTRCLPPRKAYDFIDWRVIFLLAGLLPVGLALETTGAAESAAHWVIEVTGHHGPEVVLSVFFLLAAILTGVMSNIATAALLAPLAFTFAAELGVSPRPFLIALTFAASAAFYTPIGYQTNLLVYGPGGYRFTDFVRIGGPLTLLYWVAGSLLIPRVFPF